MALRRCSGSFTVRPASGTAAPAPHDWFELTVNPDGSRTLHTLTRFPGNALVRQVTQTVDAGFAPLEGYARLFIGGDYAGSVLRQVAGNVVHSSVQGPDGSVDRADIDVPEGTVLGYHPVVGEGWKFVRSPRRQGTQRLHVLTTSSSWNGGTMGHGKLVESSFEWLPEEEIETAAGRMRCEHLMWDTGEVAGRLEMWLVPPHYLCARLLQHRRKVLYELESLQEQVLPDVAEFAFE